MIVSWTDGAWEQFEYWLDTDKKVVKKIRTLIKDTKRNGYDGIGKPEPLKDDLQGLWSKRIDTEHRFVYFISGFENEKQTLHVISVRYHYGKY